MKLPMRGVGATAEDYELADRQRRLHLEHTPGYGVKTKPAWTRHQPTWALAYSRIRGEATRKEIEAAQDWAYSDKEEWRDGTEGWNAVLAAARNPAETICRNIARLATAGRRSKATKHKLEKYSPGAGSPMMYYVDDVRVSYAKYKEAGGK
jgi:hypothetical protein